MPSGYHTLNRWQTNFSAFVGKLLANHNIYAPNCLRINQIKPYKNGNTVLRLFFIILLYSRGFISELPESRCPRSGPYNVSFYKSIAGNASITIKEQIAKALLQIKRGQFTPNCSSSRRSVTYCIHIICRIHRYLYLLWYRHIECDNRLITISRRRCYRKISGEYCVDRRNEG